MDRTTPPEWWLAAKNENGKLLHKIHPRNDAGASLMLENHWRCPLFNINTFVLCYSEPGKLVLPKWKILLWLIDYRRQEFDGIWNKSRKSKFMVKGEETHVLKTDHRVLCNWKGIATQVGTRKSGGHLSLTFCSTKIPPPRRPLPPPASRYSRGPVWVV